VEKEKSGFVSLRYPYPKDHPINTRYPYSKEKPGSRSGSYFWSPSDKPRPVRRKNK
jgi:hypothetical protein